MSQNTLLSSLITVLMVLTLSMSSSVYAEKNDDKPSVAPKSGLVLPDDYNTAEDKNNDKDKKCMTVCDKWGEDCLVNPRTGSRNCRKICKSFAEQCF